MKLARIGAVGSESLAAVDADGTYRDISTAFADLTPALLADPAPLLVLDLASFPVVVADRIGPCLGR